MINKITKKAILDIKKNVDAYDKEMAAINEKIATIDEKYRKLMEKETKELRESYAALEEEQEIWNASLSRYDVDIVNEVLGNASIASDEESETTSDITEEKIVDTIYEKNNTIETESTENAIEDISVAEEDENLSTENDFPFEEDVKNNDENVATKESSASATDSWPESEEKITEPPVTEMSEDEWPELPENW